MQEGEQAKSETASGAGTWDAAIVVSELFGGYAVYVLQQVFLRCQHLGRDAFLRAEGSRRS
jgi:hypothetical protein